jgi:ubiquinone/menaquinone biosynthesis C-methylase UbiE
VSSAHLNKAAKRFDDWASDYGEDRISPWFKYHQELAISRLNLTAGNNFLDVGCGTGWAVKEASKRIGDGNAWGIDISPKMISKAKLQFEELSNVEFGIASSDSLPFYDETFDAVICTCSFHHYEYPIKVLCEFKRVMKNDGKLVIIDAARNISLPIWIQDRFRRYFEKSHVKYYTIDEFVQLIHNSGFKCEGDITILKKLMLHKKLFTGMVLFDCRKNEISY